MKKLKTYKQLFEETNFDKKFNKDYFIKLIYLIIHYSDETIYNSGDFELQSDPIYRENENTMELIDTFYEDEFGYTIYGGYKMETVLDNNYSSYNNLDKETLEELVNILSSALSYNYITYDNLELNEKIYKDMKYIYDNIDNFYKDFEYDTFDEYKKQQKIKDFNI